MTFAGWLLLAVLTVWGVVGPLLAYCAGLAGPGAPEAPQDALRDLVVPHTVPASPERDWTPGIPPIFWPDPDPEDSTFRPARTVWEVPGIGTANLDLEFRAYLAPILEEPSTERAIAIAERTEKRLTETVFSGGAT